MGFREGVGLGKGGSGISEPIALNVSCGRAGLGVIEEKRREKAEMHDARKVHETSLRESFLDNQKRSFETNQLTRDLRKAQKACEQLDLACGITQSDLWTSQDDLASSNEGRDQRQEVVPFVCVCVRALVLCVEIGECSVRLAPSSRAQR